MSVSQNYRAGVTVGAATPLITRGATLASLSLPRAHLDRQLVVGFESRDGRSRPFNLLRTQLAKIMERDGLRAIGITSATPGAGKTFTSVNLAAALSRSENKPVLLCDLDLRRGSMITMLGAEFDHGLDDYLEGNVDDAGTLALRVNDSNLVVIPTRASGSGSSELLAGERPLSGRRALPPLFANDDAMLCMEHLDGYPLVVDHGQSTAKQVEETIALLQPAPCVGTVLNRYQGGFADPYGYGYGDTYGLKDYGDRRP